MFSYPPFVVAALLIFILSFVPVFGGNLVPPEDQELWKEFLAWWYPAYTMNMMLFAGVMGSRYSRYKFCQRARQARKEAEEGMVHV